MNSKDLQFSAAVYPGNRIAMGIVHRPTGIEVEGETTGSLSTLRNRLLDELHAKLTEKKTKDF
jgi:protein subunit release factor A